MGSDQGIAVDGSAVYTLSVTNNDTPACPATAFDLSLLSETGNTASFSLPSSLSVATVTVAAGASNSTVTLTVTGNGTGANGDSLDSTVELRDDTDHGGQQQADTVRTTLQAVVCTRNPPTFNMGADQTIGVSDSTVYTLSVSNNDTAACPNTAFNLSILSETGNTASFSLPSILSASMVTVAPGVNNSTVILTVTGNGTGANGDLLDSTVEVRDDADHAGQQQSDTVRTTVQAALMCSDYMNKTSCRNAGCRWKKGACQDP
jgi:hypothetical protein